MLANVQQSASPSAAATEAGTVPASSSPPTDNRVASEDEEKTTPPLAQALPGSINDQASAAEDARARERELEESLRGAQEVKYLPPACLLSKAPRRASVGLVST